MATDKVRVEVIGAPDFFATIAGEADRVDHSQSWVMQKCLERSLPALATVAPGSAALEALKRSPLRNPATLHLLRFNLALAESDSPDARALASAPRGTERRTFFLPRALYDAFDREGERLKLSSDEILMWAWDQVGAEIRALASVTIKDE